MTYEITKNARVFDQSKINVGDIITFHEYKLKLFGENEISHERVGIVDEVELDCVWVRTQDTYTAWGLERIGLPIERANEIKIIYRSYYNVGKGEKYGEIY